MKFIFFLLSIIFTGIFFPACSPCYNDTPKDRITRWLASGKPPASNIKTQTKLIKYSELPPQYTAENTNNSRTTYEEIDLDNDGVTERIIHIGSGNRNNEYIILKKQNSQWTVCGTLLGTDIIPIKHKNKVVFFCKTAIGYETAIYSCSELQDQKIIELIRIQVTENKPQ